MNLSTDGNDRCIAGGSSGGITAFAAAWNRPAAFSRVYAVSGSFVAFRGGQEFPTMVRKFEAKPIRAFLTTGTHDMENCAGDWFLLDQKMAKALKFSANVLQSTWTSTTPVPRITEFRAKSPSHWAEPSVVPRKPVIRQSSTRPLAPQKQIPTMYLAWLSSVVPGPENRQQPARPSIKKQTAPSVLKYLAIANGGLPLLG